MVNFRFHIVSLTAVLLALGLGLLLGTTFLDDMIPLLRDPSAQVVREATVSLRPRRHRLPAGLLSSLLADERPASRLAAYSRRTRRTWRSRPPLARSSARAAWLTRLVPKSAAKRRPYTSSG